MLQFFSASTGIVNSRRAIRECLEIALEGEPNLDCDLIIFHSSMGHNFKELLSEARKLAPGSQIAGCTGAGVIGAEGPNQTMKALGIMAIKGPKSEFAVTADESWENKDPFEVASGLSGKLHQLNPGTRMILFFPPAPGLLPADKMIEGVGSVFGPDIPVFGGNAIDNMKGISCFQFFNDRIIEKGALMIGFSDPTLKVFAQASHGMKVMKEMPFEATRAESNIIFEFNGQPAWKMIAKTLDIPESTPWPEYGMLAFLANEVPAPFQDALGEHYSLNILFADPETGVLICNRTVKQGSYFYLAKRNEELMFQGVDHIAHRIAGHLEGKQPAAVFHADCIIRGRASFDRVLKDEIVARMQYPICQGRNIPWLGFYSGGEYAHIGGKNMFHIFTTTLNVLYRNDE
jgi:hypothetical protein